MGWLRPGAGIWHSAAKPSFQLQRSTIVDQPLHVARAAQGGRAVAVFCMVHTIEKLAGCDLVCDLKKRR
jgi:hypothetical protein